MGHVGLHSANVSEEDNPGELVTARQRDTGSGCLALVCNAGLKPEGSSQTWGKMSDRDSQASDTSSERAPFLC